MSETFSSRTPHHQILAVICFGLFAGAMALNSMQTVEEGASPSEGMMWITFQCGLPLLVGGMCFTRKRWAFMTAVIYGTLGLALDLATFVQSLPEGNDSWEYLIVISTTAFLNFLLITLGGRAVLQSQ